MPPWAHVTSCVSYSKVLTQNWIGVSWVRYAIPGGTFGYSWGNSWHMREIWEEDVAVGEMRDATGGPISGMWKPTVLTLHFEALWFSLLVLTADCLNFKPRAISYLCDLILLISSANRNDVHCNIIEFLWTIKKANRAKTLRFLVGIQKALNKYLLLLK